MKRFLILATMIGGFSSAFAGTIAQWNYDAASDGGDPYAPVIGAGSSHQVWDTVNGAEDSKLDAKAGENESSDPNTGAALKYWSIGVFAGTALPDSGTSGAEFFSSTVGYSDVSFLFDQRWTKNVSGYGQLEYTLDGTDWLDASVVNGVIATTGTTGVGGVSPATIDSDGVIFGSYDNTAGSEVWTNGISLDFSGVTGAADDANFGVREVAIYGPNGSYVPVATAGSIGLGSGRWRFDMATFTGTPDTPEPVSCGALALGAIAILRKRKRA